MTALITLSLMDCNLKSLPDLHQDNPNFIVSELSLDGNPLTCDSKLTWVYDLMAGGHVDVYIDDCQTPSEYSGRAVDSLWREELDLIGNVIIQLVKYPITI